MMEALQQVAPEDRDALKARFTAEITKDPATYVNNFINTALTPDQEVSHKGGGGSAKVPTPAIADV